MFPKEEHPGLTRARHQLRAFGVNRDTVNPHRSGIHSRGYLPHIKREGADYFVTFRLADSLPREVLRQYEQERDTLLRALQAAGSGPRCSQSPIQTPDAVRLEFYRKVERYLDVGAGACHLRRPQVAQLMADALNFFNESRYVLQEWVVMPNHVHVLFRPASNHLVGEIVKSWKQFTSHRAKRLLGLPPGRFWQPEAYDHWVRNDLERARIARYIRNNPVIAGLCDRSEGWPWGSARPGDNRHL